MEAAEQHWNPQFEQIITASEGVNQDASLHMRVAIRKAISTITKRARGESQYGTKMDLDQMRKDLVSLLRTGWASMVGQPDEHQQRQFELALMKIQNSVTTEQVFPEKPKVR